MDLKNLFETDSDERAVSPVIGVILMVAITVILAAVIGAFVIGIGDDQEQVPQASWDWDQNGEDDITLSHNSGATISDDNLLLQASDYDAFTFDGSDFDDAERAPFDETDGVSAGSSVTVEFDGYNDAEDESLNLVWESDSGGDSSVLTERDIR